MKTQNRADRCGFPHNARRQRFIGQRNPVIRKSRCACRQQGGHIHRFPALQPFGHGAAALHMNPRLPAFFQYIGQCCLVVHNRSGICHQYHGCESASRRRPAAAYNVLFVGKSGIAEMNVYIDQARCDGQAVRIVFLHAGHIRTPLPGIPHPQNPPFVEKNIPLSFISAARIHHITVPNQKSHTAAPVSYFIRKRPGALSAPPVPVFPV